MRATGPRSRRAGWTRLAVDVGREPALRRGDPRRLRPVPRAELLDRRGQVVADRPLRQGQLAARCRRPCPSVDATRGPPARGRRAGSGPRSARRAASAGSTTRWPAATRRIGRGEVARRRVLQQEPGRAGLHRPAQVARPPERREDQRPGTRAAPARSCGRRGQPVQPGHLDVEQRDVGPVSQRRGTTSSPRPTWATTSMSSSSREQRGERPAHHRLVLGEQDPDHAAASAGIGTADVARRYPPAGAGPASSRPPSRAGRSRQAVQPGPGPSRAPGPPVASAVPSSTTSSRAASPSRDDRIDARVAALWRRTLVTPSRTAQREHGVDVRRQPLRRGLDRRLDPGRVERGPRPGELRRERRPAVPADRLADGRERLAATRSTSAISAARALRVAGQQPPGQLALERDQRQAVAEQCRAGPARSAPAPRRRPARRARRARRAARVRPAERRQGK